jgi:hypothetical protein
MGFFIIETKNRRLCLQKLQRTKPTILTIALILESPLEKKEKNTASLLFQFRGPFATLHWLTDRFLVFKPARQVDHLIKRVVVCEFLPHHLNSQLI